MMRPAAACDAYPLADGVLALPGGFALLTHSRALLCADAHLGYEDVMGGGAALPLWSTDEITASIALAAGRCGAREIVFLGDAIHGAGLSACAARAVGAALETLRAHAVVTVVAGNHEGRSRGVAVLGATVEATERDGWTLAHGDRPVLEPGARAIIGHLHPSIRLGGDVTAQAFLAARTLVVVPALTPYSPGLDVTRDACADALAAWNVRPCDVQVVGATSERVYPFGALSALRAGSYLRDAPEPLGKRRSLRPSPALRRAQDDTTSSG